MAVVDQPAPAVDAPVENVLTASGLTGETLTLNVLKGVPGGEQAEVTYQVPVVAGMVILDGDVAVDPLHIAQMLDAVRDDLGSVHVAPVKIWPAGTQWKSWAWAHYDETGPSQEWDVEPRYFGFNFTYLPKQLIRKCLSDGLKDWTYPNCDSCVSQRARQLKLPCRLVRDCFPVHLHW